MTLHALVERYIALHQALGKPFHATAGRLRSFARIAGPRRAVRSLTRGEVRRYLAPTGPLTRNYHSKYSALRGLFRYARSHGDLDADLLPAVVPKLPPRFAPHIYTHDELRRVLAAVDRPRRSRTDIEPATLRTVVLLQYGAGLRISEALALDRSDVDLTQNLLTVRRSKSFRSRLVPVAAPLGRVLAEYARRPSRIAAGPSPFFATRHGERVKSPAMQKYFRRVCERAAVRRRDGVRQQPRLHDLRHSFAVHRLTAAYRQGLDVQTLVSHLGTYLGHVHLAATQVYLSMTPELLTEAGCRFECYAAAEASHA